MHKQTHTHPLIRLTYDHVADICSTRATDLTMKEMQNSRERELDDWKNLFSMADPRFLFQEARQPPGSNLWIMVVEWQEAAATAS